MVDPLKEFKTRYMSLRFENPGLTVRDYEWLNQKLIDVSGCDIEKLIELFAAGYTLQPPNNRNLNRILGDLV